MFFRGCTSEYAKTTEDVVIIIGELRKLGTHEEMHDLPQASTGVLLGPGPAPRDKPRKLQLSQTPNTLP